MNTEEYYRYNGTLVLNKPSLLQIMYQQRINKPILRNGLHHIRPLVPQQAHNSWNVNLLIMIHSIQQQIAEYCKSRATDASGAVHENRRVLVVSRRYLAHRVLLHRLHLFEESEKVRHRVWTALFAPVGVVQVP